MFGSGLLGYLGQMLSLDRKTNDTSIALDALRAVAAQAVCVGHGFTFFSVAEWLRPPHFPFIQNIGVLLFFIMSGFLITGTLFQNSLRADYSFARYFIDRFARIYSGLLPTLAFVVVVDGVMIWLTNEPTISSYYTFKTLVANLAMLEGYRGVFDHSYFQWSAFGSASPLWTLAIEWHIYMFVGAAFFLLKRRGWWPVLVVIALFSGQTALHFLFGMLQSDGVGHGLFSLWLGGSALYLLLGRYVPSLWISIPMFGLAVFAYGYALVPGHEYDMATYPVLILAVGSLIAITQKTKVLRNAPTVATIIRTAADYSFTLYLIHYTIMYAIMTIFSPALGWPWFCTAVAISNVVAYLIALPTEMRHRQFAAWLRNIPSKILGSSPVTT
jgi:peptidoglycan/LPS O-acetylase OafA/YrhL